MSFRQRVRQILGAEAVELLSFGYAVDWLVSFAFWIISGFITRSTPFQREFSLEDTLISHPFAIKQQISGVTNHNVSWFLPVVIFGAVAGVNRSTVEAHHAMLGLFTARGLARLITEFLKNRIGRLRPDFLARCKWDATLKACTGKASDILDGRRSFPSGHSSTIFAGMGFLALWIAGKTAAWCITAPIPPRGVLSTRLGRVAITLCPLFFATWVAISRVEDYRHHKEDVVVGSLIGLLTAALGYLMYWPNPFLRQNFVDEVAGRPRMLYSDAQDVHTSRNGAYELTRLEDETA